MKGGFTLAADFSASLWVALLDETGNCAAFRVREQGERSESALDLLDACLREVGGGYDALARIAVGVGPGSFTGIRVAASFAQGLAFAGRLPVHPFSSLAALRACAPGGGESAVAAIAGNAGRYFVSHGSPAVEALLGATELEALAAIHPNLITSGSIPEAERFAQAFSSATRMEDAIDFLRVFRLAIALPAVYDGMIRPNYITVSAAEAKRMA